MPGPSDQPQTSPEKRDSVALFVDYLAVEAGLSPHTIEAYRGDLERFRRFLRRARAPFPEGATRERVGRFLRHCQKKGYATATLRRHVSSLRTFYRFLVMEGAAADNPTALLLLPKTWRRLPRTLSQPEVERLLAASRAGKQPRRDGAILELLYSTGLRVSELCSLRLGELRLGDGFLRCRGKGGKERLVPVGSPAVRSVEDYCRDERPRLATKRPGTDALFLSRTGRPLGRETVGRIVKRAAARAGVSLDSSPHTLRHSFASHLLAGGAGLREVQELLGHSDIRTTEIYTHVDADRLKDAHRKFHPRG